MTKINWIAFLCVGAVPVAVLAPATGCSTSNTASPATVEAGAEASTSNDDAGSGASGVSLTWGTQIYTVPTVVDGGATSVDSGSPSDGGSTSDSDAAAEGGTATDAGLSDAGTSGDDAGGGLGALLDAGDGGATVVADGGVPSGDGGIPGVPGVRVCAYLSSKLTTGTVPAESTALACVTSAADGTFVFPDVPVRTNLALTLNKTGFVPVVLSISTASTPMDSRSNPVYMFPVTSQTDPVPGVTVDWQNKGQVYMFIIGPAPDGGSDFAGEPGATVSMSPASGNGPYYTDPATGLYVPSATSFIENTGAFFNVTPGTVTLTFADSKVNCQPISSPFGLWGFPVTTPDHALQALVWPGYVSGLVGVLCTDVPQLVAVDGG